MKTIVVGNICKRIELRNNKKTKPEMAGSYISALTASKLGHDVTLVSRIPDVFDNASLKKLKDAKIKLQKQTAWKETVYESKYEKDGKTTKVLSDAGPIVRIEKEGDYEVVLISSYYGYVNSDVIKMLKKHARDEDNPGNIVMLDAQSYIKHRGADGMLVNKPWLDKEKYLKNVDIIRLNVRELFYLTGKVSLNSASDLLKLGPKVIILTVPDKCNYVFHGKTYTKMPFYKQKTKRKFYIGLGEIYDTAFALKYAETRDPKESGFFAEAAASFCLQRNCVKTPLKKTEVNKRFKLLKDIFLA